jgi:hypothetical protein
MNQLLEAVYKSRGGHYCHVIEVSNIYELQICAESIYNENIDEFSKETILDFLETLEVYCLDENNEDEVYSFSFTDYINKLI